MSRLIFLVTLTYVMFYINFKQTNQSCWSSKISQSINVEWRTCNRNGKQIFQWKQEKLWWFDKVRNVLIKTKIDTLRAVKNGVQKIAPGKKCPAVRVRVLFRISVRITAGGKFSSRAIFPEPLKNSLLYFTQYLAKFSRSAKRTAKLLMFRSYFRKRGSWY